MSASKYEGFLLVLVLGISCYPSICKGIDWQLVNSLNAKAEIAIANFDTQEQVRIQKLLRSLYAKEFGELSWQVQRCDLHLVQAHATKSLSNKQRDLLKESFNLLNVAAGMADDSRFHLAIQTQQEAM